jgi:hypothetical protein
VHVLSGAIDVVEDDQRRAGGPGALQRRQRGRRRAGPGRVEHRRAVAVHLGGELGCQEASMSVKSSDR